MCLQTDQSIVRYIVSWTTLAQVKLNTECAPKLDDFTNYATATCVTNSFHNLSPKPCHAKYTPRACFLCSTPNPHHDPNFHTNSRLTAVKLKINRFKRASVDEP